MLVSAVMRRWTSARRRIRLREGRTLGELAPAPPFVALWQTPDAGKTLLVLLVTARSRLVRLWAMELLKREQQDCVATIPIEDLLRLLEHADEEVQQFGARLLEESAAVAKLPVATWFKLLHAEDSGAGGGLSGV